MTRALVVFHGFGAWRWQRLLKPGFRHVFCAIDDGTAWIAVDGKAGVPAVQSLAPSEYDLAGWFRGQGFTVMPWQPVARRAGPLVAGSCVGMVKAMLGMRSAALTPWQLYRWMKRHG